MILERLQRLGKRERLALAIMGAIVVALLIDRFAAAPVVRAVKVFNAAIDEQEGQVALNRGIENQQGRVDEAYRAVETWVARRAPTSVAIDKLKAQVDDMASKAGLKIGSMEQREPRMADHTETYIVEIGNFEAAVPDLARFLHGMASLQDATRVARLTLESDTAGRRVRGSMAITKTVLKPRS